MFFRKNKKIVTLSQYFNDKSNSLQIECWFEARLNKKSSLYDIHVIKWTLEDVSDTATENIKEEIIDTNLNIQIGRAHG